MLSGHCAIVVCASSRHRATSNDDDIEHGCDVRSFGGRRRCISGSCRLLLPEQPVLQLIEIDIDNRRRIESEYLRQSEAADDRVTERLANLRAAPRTHHHRHGAEQRRHRRHQDRAKALDAGLVDRFLGRQAFVLFGLHGEIHQHDAVLLDDANQQYEADDRDHAQIDVHRQQQQQRADAGRGQRRDNRDRVDQALIEHAEDQVDNEQRREYENRRALQRRAEGLGVALEAGLERQRRVQRFFDRLNIAYRLANRGARCEVERDCHRRELTCVVNHKRRNLYSRIDQRGYRHLLSARRFDIDAVERFGSILEFGVDLQDDMVLLQGGVDRGDDTLAEGVVERIVDRVGQDAVARGDIALDRDVEQRPGIQLIGGDIGDAVERLELFEEQVRPMVEFALVGVVQGVLKLGLVQPRADRNVLSSLHIKGNALDLGEVRPQPRYHLVDWATLLFGLELNEYTTIVDRVEATAGPRRRSH